MAPDTSAKFADMREKTFLVVGATGHVGSKVAIRLGYGDSAKKFGPSLTSLAFNTGADRRNGIRGLNALSP